MKWVTWANVTSSCPDAMSPCLCHYQIFALQVDYRCKSLDCSGYLSSWFMQISPSSNHQLSVLTVITDNHGVKGDAEMQIEYLVWASDCGKWIYKMSEAE